MLIKGCHGVSQLTISTRSCNSCIVLSCRRELLQALLWHKVFVMFLAILTHCRSLRIQGEPIRLFRDGPLIHVALLHERVAGR